MSEEKILKSEKEIDEISRRSEFEKLFENVDGKERELIDRLIAEAIFCEEQMTELKKLPFIAVNPKNAQQQKITSAARLYKDYSASYRDTIRIMLNILRKVDSDEQNDLLRRLEEFT